MDSTPADNQLNEKNIYLACDGFILVFVALIPVVARLMVIDFSILVCKAPALFSFGTSRFIKGRAPGDTGRVGEHIYKEKSSIK